MQTLFARGEIMAYSYKTAIEFGLVYIPITLHACIKSKDVGFNMIHKKTGQRIKYKKTCENCPANISNDDIVKGYEYKKGKYVTLTDEELEKIKSPKDKSISIDEFVLLDEIDPILFDKAFYVLPQGADKAFSLFLKALEEEKKVAIAKTVLGTKEQVIMIMAKDGKLILNTLHFYDEVQEVAQKETSKVAPAELKLAKSLIDNMTGKFDPAKYKDEYREKVLDAINKKINGESIKKVKQKKLPNNVINLMDALKKSLEQAPPAKKKQG